MLSVLVDRPPDESNSMQICDLVCLVCFCIFHIERLLRLIRRRVNTPSNFKSSLCVGAPVYFPDSYLR